MSGEKKTLLHSKRLKIFLGVMLALLGACAIATSVLIVDRQQSLARVSRYNLTWLMSQGVNETTRLLDAIAASSIAGSGVGQDEVEQRLEILRNRLNVLRFGEGGDFIATDIEFTDTVGMLAGFLGEAPPLVQRIPDLGAIRQLRERLEPLVPRMLRLAAASNNRSGDLVARDQQELSRLHWTLEGLLFGIMACATVLVCMIFAVGVRMLRALQVAKEAAEAANAAKTQFLANMSHELRTPLNGLLGMLELVVECDLSGDQEKYLRTAIGSGNVLFEHISQLLEFSRIEAKEVRFETVDVDIRALLDEVSQMMRTQIAAKDLGFSARVAVEVPRVFVSDEARIRQVLLNLIGNAVKFTHSGQITVAVGLAEAAGGGAQVRISVQDTGIGIPPDKRTTIFDPFMQADISNTRRYGGVGLGLSIVNNIVRGMGGTVSLESTVGLGSTFHVFLPLQVVSEGGEVGLAAVGAPDQSGAAVGSGANSAALAVSMSAQRLDVVSRRLPGREREAHGVDGSGRAGGERPSEMELGVEAPIKKAPQREVRLRGVAGQRIKVLLVEDDRVSREVARMFLEKAGCEVDLAVNGREAVELYSPGKYEFIFMDRHMPEMDGIAATREIRRLEALVDGKTVIIGLSAGALASERDLCLDAGMDEYLTKPVRMEKINLTIQHWRLRGRQVAA